MIINKVLQGFKDYNKRTKWIVIKEINNLQHKVIVNNLGKISKHIINGDIQLFIDEFKYYDYIIYHISDFKEIKNVSLFRK